MASVRIGSTWRNNAVIRSPHNTSGPGRFRKAEPGCHQALSQHGHHDCSIPAAVAVYERSAGCSKVRRGYRNGSYRRRIHHCVRNDAASAASGRIYRFRTSDAVFLCEAAGCREGDSVPSVAQKRAVAQKSCCRIL